MRTGFIVPVDECPRRSLLLEAEREPVGEAPGQSELFVAGHVQVPVLVHEHEPEPEAPGFVVVPWDAVDTWLEEGRELVNYPPNPYHRVDCRPTTRRLRVEVAGTTLVDTDDTLILFETALEPRLYVAPTLVRTDLLRRTETSSYCNYKGVATWWSAVIGDTVVEDVAWSYEDPLPESSPIKGCLSFDLARAAVHAELPVGT
jgi:uncharacterized protein (DUF427 family)